MKRSLTQQISLGFAIALLLLLSNAIVSYRNILKLINNERSITQSYQNILELEATLSTLKDAETGQRGYLLTGRERYLEPYQTAIAQINQRVERLQQTATTPLQQQQLQALDQAIAARFSQLDQVIQRRRTQGLNAAIRDVQTDRGQQLMDEIRRQIRTIEAQENQQLQQRKTESQQSLNATLLTFTSVTGASLLLLALIAIVLRQNAIQRHQAELSLKEREERLQIFVKYAPVGIAMFDRTMRYLAASQRWIDDYNLGSIEELLGRSHYEVFPNISDEWKRVHQRGMAGQSEKRQRDYYVLPDGSEQYLRWEVQPWRDQSGAVSGILVFVENITQKTQIEAALSNSEQQFRATFNQAAVGIAHVAPDGTWLLVNQKLCEIVGYSREEFLQLTFQDITYSDDLEIDLTYVQQMLANQIQSYSMEKRYIHKDRSLVWVNLTVTLVREPDGQPKYFISVIEDIRDRKQAESDLQQLNATLAQRIEQRTAQITEVNHELEAFTYTVSHDLRAPLRIMQGFSQALEEDYGHQLDELAKTYIESISESAVQMDTLINDLLSYSRLSRTEIRLQSVNLGSAIAAALKQLSADIQAQNAIVRVSDQLPSVIAHRSILIQVLINLISNAIKFVEPGVQPIVTITAQVERNSVRLTVVDNGIGIADKYHDRIFRVFERLHGVETFPGTGIGLAIVRKAIDRMNGQVGLESQLEHGSRFWIVLPLAFDKLLDSADLTHDSTPHSLN